MPRDWFTLKYGGWTTLGCVMVLDAAALANAVYNAASLFMQSSPCVLMVMS